MKREYERVTINMPTEMVAWVDGQAEKLQRRVGINVTRTDVLRRIIAARMGSGKKGKAVEPVIDFTDPFVAFTRMLSTRGRNTIKNLDIDSLEEVEAALADGSIVQSPNCGRGTVQEVKYWLSYVKKHGVDAVNKIAVV